MIHLQLFRRGKDRPSGLSFPLFPRPLSPSPPNLRPNLTRALSRGKGSILNDLRVPWPVRYQKIDGEDQRPLVGQTVDGQGLLLREPRAPLYEQNDLIVDCHLDRPEQVARRIAAESERA